MNMCRAQATYEQTTKAIIDDALNFVFNVCRTWSMQQEIFFLFGTVEVCR